MAASRPGYRTSEFWLAALAAIIGLVAGSGAVGDAGPAGKALAFVAAALASAGYSYSRALTKGKSDEGGN